MSVLRGRRAVLRLAARDAGRHKGRSALVVTMVALPVLVLSAVDVVARTGNAGTSDGPPTAGAADAVLQALPFPVQQTPDGDTWYGTGEPTPAARSAEDVAADLGATRVVSDTRSTARYAATDGSRRLDLRQLDYADPLAEGLVRQLDGRAPRTPQEVAVTPELARLAGVEVGDRLELTRPAAALTVVGTVAGADDAQPTALTLPGAVPVEQPDLPDQRYLVDTADPVTWDEVLALNERGYVVTSAAVLADPPDRADVPYFETIDSSGTGRTELAAFVALAAGMALLEVVLLAGPAVAVGARRSRRLLALVAATGGDRRQVRDVVLGQGLVLGAVAGVVGVALGVPLGVLAVASIERFTDAVLPDPVVRPLDLLALALVAAVTAVLASVVPARSVSRQDVSLALAERREPVRTRRRVPVLGGLLALTGLVLVLGGIDRRSALAILAGAALGQVGLVLCTPVLVTLTGRLGGVLPLTPRLALRDSVRHVGRTAPAVAAVMAAVAGSVAIGIVVASQAERDERAYTASVPIGDAVVNLDTSQATDADVAAVEQVVARELPVAEAVVLRTLDGACRTGPCGPVYAELPPANRCPLSAPRPSDAEVDAARDDPRCAGLFQTSGTTISSAGLPAGTIVDDGTALAAVLDREAPEARAALARGQAVVFDPLLLRDGQARLRVERGQGAAGSRPVQVPAVVVPGAVTSPSLVVPPGLAEQLRVRAVPSSLYLRTSRLPTEAEQDAAQTALDRAGYDASVQVERGYQDAYLPGLLALVVGAAVITLGARGDRHRAGDDRRPARPRDAGRRRSEPRGAAPALDEHLAGDHRARDGARTGRRGGAGGRGRAGAAAAARGVRELLPGLRRRRLAAGGAVDQPGGDGRRRPAAGGAGRRAAHQGPAADDPPGRDMTARRAAAVRRARLLLELRTRAAERGRPVPHGALRADAGTPEPARRAPGGSSAGPGGAA